VLVARGAFRNALLFLLLFTLLFLQYVNELFAGFTALISFRTAILKQNDCIQQRDNQLRVDNSAIDNNVNS